MASQILPPNTLVVVVGVIMELRPIITPQGFWAQVQLFEMVFSKKDRKMLFYKDDLLAFHTHFINFGGVGIDEKAEH